MSSASSASSARGAGVLSDGRLVSARRDAPAGRVRLPRPFTLADLHAAALELDICDVFAHPVSGWAGFDEAGRGYEGLPAAVADGPAELGGGLVVACTGDQPEPWRWQVSYPPVNVVSLAADAHMLSGPLWGLTPAELVRALRALEGALRVPWASSVGQTVQRLIRSTHPAGKGGRLLEDAPAAPAPCEGGGLELPWASWRRELTRDEARAPFVHVFDANAQYLAAWQVAELGFGEPRHVTAPRFGPRQVGVWRVDLAGLEPAYPLAALLPVPWLPGREWVTTPTLHRALEVVHGADAPDVSEAWVWPEHARYLRGAGERLRDARATGLSERRWAAARLESLPAGAPDSLVDDAVTRDVLATVILEAVKSLYVVGTGRLNMPRAAGNRWARPDWGHTVRATARVNLHRRLCKLSAAPFAIATDALVFAAAEPDGLAFAASLATPAATRGLPIGDGLGEFRHEGTLPAGELGADLLGSGTVTGILERAGALLEARDAATVPNA